MWTRRGFHLIVYISFALNLLLLAIFVFPRVDDWLSAASGRLHSRCEHCGSWDAEVTDSAQDEYWIRNYYKCRECGNVWTSRHHNPDSDWW